MRPLETSIEDEVRRRVLRLSTPERPILFLKLNAIGVRGMPDRALLWYPCRVLFVEFKRPGETPRKLQVYIHDLLRRLGFEVSVHDDVEEAMQDIKAHLGEID